jgi:hypothetical protein
MEVFNILITWFQANLLSLNLSKTHYIKFSTKNVADQAPFINTDNGIKGITSSCFTKFLGINITNTLSWKEHIDQLLLKLNAACYAIRTLQPYVTHETLQMVYHAYFHSIMQFGIIFWGNSSYTKSVFCVQKRVLRIIAGTGYRNSCRQLFKTLKILPLQSQYIYSLLCFVVNNFDSFRFITEIHNRNTRHRLNLNLYQPPIHLALYQKGTHCMGIKVYNSLPVYLKQLTNKSKHFKIALKDFLTSQSFYTLEEYFEHCRNIDSSSFQ